MKKINLLSLVLLTSLACGIAHADTTKKAAKKVAAPAAAAPAAAAPAAKAYSRPYGMAGCGFGTYVVGKDGSQILGATTNDTLYSQTFGITFGTLNCNDSENLATTAARLDNFIASNKVSVATDAAKGDGETIAVLAKLMNCSDSANLGPALQSHFSNIFTRYDLKANEISDNLITVVNGDASLSKQCNMKI